MRYEQIAGYLITRVHVRMAKELRFRVVTIPDLRRSQITISAGRQGVLCFMSIYGFPLYFWESANVFSRFLPNAVLVFIKKTRYHLSLDT
jgi:hypothetical protein